MFHSHFYLNSFYCWTVVGTYHINDDSGDSFGHESAEMRTNLPQWPIDTLDLSEDSDNNKIGCGASLFKLVELTSCICD
jgi:hypothetical protein